MSITRREKLSIGGTSEALITFSTLDDNRSDTLDRKATAQVLIRIFIIAACVRVIKNRKSTFMLIKLVEGAPARSLCVYLVLISGYSYHPPYGPKEG